jgi:predicted Fe-Mo cluster-binding NifX family protein
MGGQNNITKIAVTTNDGVSIAAHFGMAEKYKVISIEGGQIIHEEERPKPHHEIHPNLEQAGQHNHLDMLTPIRDCQVLLCGGMRDRAYMHATEAGLDVIMVAGNVEEAVRQYLAGTLVSDMRRVRHN